MATQIIYDSLTKDEAIIYIDESTTDAAVTALKRCIEKHQINPSKFDNAEIFFDCTKGIDLDPDDILGHYPLMFKDTVHGHYVHISGVSAGYGGAGPHGTLNCLKMMGFMLSDDEKESVLTKKKLANNEEDPIVFLAFNK